MNRKEIVRELEERGKDYNFARFSTPQLYCMLRKLKKKEIKASSSAAFDSDEDEDCIEPLSLFSTEYCDKCGSPLNDAGECPNCDLGDESELDEDFRGAVIAVPQSVLEEGILIEVYPHKNENKKDFIVRFMSATKKEYPDIKQRYAVANSYWDRRSDANEDLEENFDYGTGAVVGDNIFDTKQLGGFSDYEITIPGNKYYQYAIDKKNLKGEIVQMSPKEYFDICAREIFHRGNGESLKQQRGEDKEEIEDLKKVITVSKKQFPMCFINYADSGQEGLHRMYTAGELFGWNHKFPVLVIKWANEDKHNQYLKYKHDFGIKQAIETAYSKASSSIGYVSVDDFESELNYDLEYELKYYDYNNITLTPNIEKNEIEIQVDDIKIVEPLPRIEDNSENNKTINESLDVDKTNSP